MLREKKKGGGKGGGITSEALSFPAAGSLKRQLVSPKRGRARNNEAAQVKSLLDTAMYQYFYIFYLLSYTNPGSEQLSQVTTTISGLLSRNSPKRATQCQGIQKKTILQSTAAKAFSSLTD